MNPLSILFKLSQLVCLTISLFTVKLTIILIILGIVSAVIDSYDVFTACREFIGNKLKAQIIERGKNGGIFVVRPDSGDPKEVVIQVNIICQFIMESLKEILILAFENS